MNKKIFAALASATMALSATGSLAVFAEDFDVVEENNNGTANGSTSTQNNVVVNTENFPDDNVRDFVMAWGTAATGNPVKYGDKIAAKYFDDVTSLTLTYDSGTNGWSTDTVSTATTPNYKGNTAVENLQGIEFFKNLETLSVTGFAKLETVDLSANTKLKSVTITGASDLDQLELPATTSLTTLMVSGTSAAPAPLTVLDLSGNKGLQTVTVNYTKVAAIDLSNNPYLTTVNLANNAINTLDLDGSLIISSLDASNNHLYSLSLPTHSPNLYSLNVSGNLLQELEIPATNNFVGAGVTAPATTALNVSDNELRTIDLSNVDKTVASLDISGNHIAGIDLKKFNTAPTTGNQIVYVGADYDTVDLAAYSEDFDKSKVDDTASATNLTNGAEYSQKSGELSNLTSEGTQYSYDTDNTNSLNVFVVPADVLNRLYNPNSGEHFYTKDLEEKDVLVGLGWHDEGIGWTSPVDSNDPVFRLYNPNAGDHHYTMSSKERDVLVSVGWKYEGIGWYSFDGDGTTNNSSEVNPTAAKPDPIPVYREYNPNAKAAGAHNYTTNEAENDFLVSVGWLEEGIAWNAMK